VPPDRSLNHAAFLWMLNGVALGDRDPHAGPGAGATRTQLNASTFAAPVIAATLADVHSAVTGAIRRAQRPLHGGANEGVMRLLLTIDKLGADPVE